MDTLDVLVKVGDSEGLATVRTLSALIIVNWKSNVNSAPEVQLYLYLVGCVGRD